MRGLGVGRAAGLTRRVCSSSAYHAKNSSSSSSQSSAVIDSGFCCMCCGMWKPQLVVWTMSLYRGAVVGRRLCRWWL